MGMLFKLLKDCDFADCSRWNAILAVVNFDLLNSNCLSCCLFKGRVDNAISSFPKFTLVFVGLAQLLWSDERACVGLGASSRAPLSLTIFCCFLIWLCLHGWLVCQIIGRSNRKLTFDHWYVFLLIGDHCLWLRTNDLKMKFIYFNIAVKSVLLLHQTWKTRRSL